MKKKKDRALTRNVIEGCTIVFYVPVRDDYNMIVRFIRAQRNNIVVMETVRGNWRVLNYGKNCVFRRDLTMATPWVSPKQIERYSGRGYRLPTLSLGEKQK